MIQAQPTAGRLAARLALGATVALASLAATTTHAAVVSVNFSGNAFSTVPFNIDGFYLNVVTGATGSTGSSVAGYDINPYFSGSTTATPLFRFLAPSTGGVVGAAGLATALPVGTQVGSGSSFVTGLTNATQPASGTYYFGFSFLNESTGATNYGFMTVAESLPIAAGAVRILGYAYENTGASITVTAVPEPSTYLMLALGLAGVGFAARRRVGS